MGRATNAATGSSYAACRSFEVAYTTSSTAEQAVPRGSYELCASTDCYLRLGRTGVAAAAALPSTAPAEGSPNATIRLFAGQRQMLDVTDGATVFRAIGATAGGTLTFNGPLLAASNE